MEGVLDGFGSKIEAKTSQNETKNECKRHKWRPHKKQKKYNENMMEKLKEISSSSKTVENLEI